MKSLDASERSFLDQRSASHTKVEKNEWTLKETCGKIMNFSNDVSVHDICKFLYNCNYSLEKIGHYFHTVLHTISVIKLRLITWARGIVTCGRNSVQILVGKSEGKLFWKTWA
jgi:hypothetical protein